MGKTFRHHPDDGCDYDDSPKVSKKELKRQRKERHRKDLQLDKNLKVEEENYVYN